MHTPREVRVFISSTFRDMHAERDHLVRVVFPELKEKCRRHRVHLTDVDLRWGVTESDAQEGRALEICLDEIDSCRPYFLGLLGHRYGWIPPGEQHSITAREIHHGVLHNDLPVQVVDLRRIVQGRLENRALSAGQIDCLQRCYAWKADHGKYLLRADAAADDLEIVRSVFAQYSAYQRDRSFFFFRSEALTRALAGSNLADFLELDEGNREKLCSLKRDIRDAGLPIYEYQDIEDFGRRVGAVLWSRVESELGQPAPEGRDWLDEEAEIHELFAEDRTRYFAGRRDGLERLHALCERNDGPSVIVLTGESGSGKSALTSRFAHEVSRRHPDWLVVSHFVGASPGSTSLRLTLRRLCSHLNRLIAPPREVPQNAKDLVKAFPDFLEKAAGRMKRIVVILDGLNQLDRADGAHAMRWLPADLPSNSRFLFSAPPGEALDALLSRQVKPVCEALAGLREPEIRELVRDYLHEFRRAFPNPGVERTFFEKVKGGNPLYILVTLEELRLFGRFEDLPERIERLPADVPALFDQVLERIEGDFDPELVRDCMSLIACGREGMTAGELQTLLAVHAPASAPREMAGRLPDMLWARLYRAFSAYLFERSSVITFFHGQLTEAVARRYLKGQADKTAVHRRIASYFDERWKEPYLRALAELPYQHTTAGDWEQLQRVVSDFDFLRAKVEAVGPHPLIDDHTFALEAGCPGEGLPVVLQALELSAHVLAEDPHQFAGQLIGRLLSCRPAAFESAIGQAARWRGRPWLRPLTARLIAPGAALERTLTGHTGSVLSLALMRGGDVAVSGGTDGTVRVWDLKRWEALDVLTLPPGGKKPAASLPRFDLGDLAGLQSPSGLRSDVSAPGCLSVTPDGRYAVLAVLRDPALWLWDLQKNTLAATLRGHSGHVYCLAVTPDGRHAVSGGADGLLLLWQLEQAGGKELRPVHSFTNHDDAVNTLDVTDDGSCVVSGSSDKTIRIWDLEQRKLLRTIHAGRPVWRVAVVHGSRRVVSISTGAIVQVWALDRPVSWLEGMARKGAVGNLPGGAYNLAVTPDGKRAVVATLGKALAVLDVERGACAAMLAEMLPDRITGIAITPDGRHALTSSNNATIAVWNLAARRPAAATVDHQDAVRTAAITLDGRIAVTGSIDRSIKVWSVETQEPLHTLSGHEGGVLAVAVTADGKLAVSGSMDNTVRVWDLDRRSELRCLKGHAARVNAVAVTRDGKYAVSGSADTTVRIWDLRTWRLLATHCVHRDAVTSLAMTLDGRRLLTASMDGLVRVWDIRLDAMGGDDVVEAIKVALESVSTPSGRVLDEASGVTLGSAIAGDGRLAVTGSAEGQLRIWDLERMCQVRTLEGPPKAVWSVSVPPEGPALLASTEGRNLNIWHMETWQRLATFSADSEFLCCAVARGGEAVVAGDAGGNVHLFRLEARDEAPGRALREVSA